MSFWDAFTKSATDAAETTKLITLRSAKQAEIMYIESQITSTLNAFGNDAYPAMEANDSERVRAYFVAAKRVVDQYRADIAAKHQDIDELNERIARVGLEDNVPAVRLERPGDVRSHSRQASGSSLNDL